MLLRLLLISISLISSLYAVSQFRVLHDFDGQDFDYIPSGIHVTSDSIYVITEKGGTNDQGTFFRIDHKGGGYELIYEFDATAYRPTGMIGNDTMVYIGTDLGSGGDALHTYKFDMDFETIRTFTETETGGFIPQIIADSGVWITSTLSVEDEGSIAFLEHDGSGFTKIYNNTSSSTGSSPVDLVFYDDQFHIAFLNGGGIPYDDGAGGTVLSGSFARLDVDGGNFSTTLQGEEGVGTNPISLIEWNNRIYGQFAENGSTASSIVFSINPDGSDFDGLVSLGNIGRGDLAIDNDTLYAITTGGLFGWDLVNGGSFQILDFLDYETFDATVGPIPTQQGMLIGTQQGGTGGAGAIFSFSSTNTQFLKITDVAISTEGTESSGIAWGDYNNDGFDDLFINVTVGGASSENLLFKNNGDCTFTNVTSEAGVDDTGQGRDATWGDYDNDGYLDLFVTNGYQNFLYHNIGDGTFSQITEGEIVTTEGVDSNGSTWGDFDNDGDLDLFIATAGNENYLYANNGDGTFTNESNSPVTAEVNNSISGAWIDYNNDGTLDLLVSNYNADDELFQNGDGTFSLVNSGPDGQFAVGSSWADYDNDGDFDLIITNNISQDRFFMNNGDGTFSIGTNAIVTSNIQASTSAWGDFNNDGWIDVVLGANHGTYLFQNGPNGFTDVTEDMGILDSTFVNAISWSDINNDGFLDLYVANTTEGTLSNNNLFYLNNGNSNNWIRINLVGTNSNRNGIGSKIRVKASDRWQTRTVQSSTGKNAQNSMTVSFGLGDASVIETLKIEWLGNGFQVLSDVSINQTIEITEPDFPSVPSNFRVVGSTSNTAQLSWSDDSNDEIGFLIERSTDLQNFVVLDTAAVNSESYLDENLEPNVVHYYRIAALKDEAYSPYTSVEAEYEYVSETDSLALVALYNATDGPNWTRSDNWLVGSVETWFGIGVTNGRVDSIHLRLHGNGLNGVIPESFYDLEELRYLRSTSNAELRGSISERIGNLTHLRYLALANNGLSGELPSSLINLTNLEILSLSLNDFEGPLPVEIGNLTRLENLFLDSNSFSGTIPESIGNLTNLVSLFLGNNALSGVLPESLYDLPIIERLHLNDNTELSGDLSRISGINSLRELNLSGCNFSGHIPPNLAKSPPFEVVQLQDNQFTSMADLTEFEEERPSTLDIGGNRIGYDDLFVNREIIGAKTNQQLFALNGEAVDNENEFATIEYVSFLEIMPNDQVTSTVAYFQWQKDGVVLSDETAQTLQVDWSGGAGDYQLEVQSVPFADDSGFAGGISYTTSAWCGSSASGTQEIIRVAQNLFTVSDWSFGAYGTCWGSGSVARGVNLHFYLIDGELSLYGRDVFGDTWWLNSVQVDGSIMTIRWENSYQESGTSVITRDDGENWPEITAAPRYNGDLVNGFPADFEFPVYVQSKTIEVTATPASTDTDYLAFSIENQEGETVIDTDNHTVTVNMLNGTDLSALIASFELSTGANAQIGELALVSAETSNDYTAPISVTITAQDATTSQDWTITVTELPSQAAEFLTFGFDQQVNAATIENDTIRITVGFGTDLSSLIATFTTSEGSNVTSGESQQTSGVTVNDFTSTFTYTVTAEDGTTTKNWVVIVSVAANTATELISFSLQGQVNSTINSENKSVAVEVPFGADLTSMEVAFQLSSGATAKLSGTLVNPGDELDFSGTATFTITAADGVTQDDWTITVSFSENLLPTIAADTFMIEENPVNGTIIGTVIANDPDNNTLTYNLVNEADQSIIDLNETSGELFVKDSVQFDFEVNPEFSVQIQVVDQRGGKASNAILIRLNDLDETMVLGLTSDENYIYPNPTYGEVMIRHPHFSSITIFDASGRKVLYSYNQKIDLSGFMPGIYQARIELTNGAWVSKKLIKR